ncbi:hypothetical protein BKA69DRAFT_1085810, partial [Paraphysoderma sedebokerense]
MSVAVLVEVLCNVLSIILSSIFLVSHIIKLYRLSKNAEVAQQQMRFVQQITAVTFFLFLSDVSVVSLIPTVVTKSVPNAVMSPAMVRAAMIFMLIRVTSDIIASGIYASVGLQRLQLFKRLFPRRIRQFPKILVSITAFLLIFAMTVHLYSSIRRIIIFDGSAKSEQMLTIPVVLNSIYFFGYFGWIIIMNIIVTACILHFVVQARSNFTKTTPEILSLIKALLSMSLFNVLIMFLALAVNIAARFNDGLLGLSSLLMRIYFVVELWCLYKIKELSAVTVVATTAAEFSTSPRESKLQRNRSHSSSNRHPPNIASHVRSPTEVSRC